MLLELKQPAEAMVEFEATLRTAPNRFDALSGAARAAKMSGDDEKAKGYYAKLLAICSRADGDRPELQDARSILGGTASGVAARSGRQWTLCLAVALRPPAAWKRLSAEWRADLERRIATLKKLSRELDGCIGCGCLSLKICRLRNAWDHLSEQGSGPLLLEPPGGRDFR